MDKVNHTALEKKIMKFKPVEFRMVGYPTELFPVNLYCKMGDGLRFYIAYHCNSWDIDYTRDKSIEARVNMTCIRGFRNQTETLKALERIIKNEPYTLDVNGRVS